MTENSNQPAAGLMSLAHWIEQVGVTACTAWRWRQKGWLKTINICGRQYISQAAISEFNARAERGEFAQSATPPGRRRPAP